MSEEAVEARPRRRYHYDDFLDTCQHMREHNTTPRELILEPFQFEDLLHDLPTQVRINAEMRDDDTFMLNDIRVTRLQYPEQLQDVNPEDWRVTTATTTYAPLEIPQEREDPTPEPFSRGWIERHLTYDVDRIDYERTVRIRGRLEINNTIQVHGEEYNEERYLIMQRQIVDWFDRKLNPNNNNEPVYTFADDTLRDYIFWLHQNVKEDFRLVADAKFDQLREKIWPAGST